MRSIMFIGLALIVFSIVAFIYRSITCTTCEKIVDVGPIHASADTRKNIPLSPLLGGLALTSGIVLVIIGRLFL